jgi:hypothetical protein
MNDNRYAGLSAGIFLIGLGLIFLLPGVGIWPWILVVIGLSGLPAGLASHRGWEAWQGAFWMIGLALLFWSGFIWPGILIMVGLSVLLGGLLPRDKRRESSRDRIPDDEPPFVVDEPLFQEDPDQERQRRDDNGTRRL